MADQLIPNAFFGIGLKSGIAQHPFVKERVIPALQKTHAKQISVLSQARRKQMVGLSGTELENRVWFAVLNDMYKHYATLNGQDRFLDFCLFSGGADRFIVWDNYNKRLDPSNGFSFRLYFSDDQSCGVGYDKDGTVSLRGKLSTTIRDGQKYSVLRVYFYVEDHTEKRDPGATSISKNVGLLCEVPYFFLRHDRYETLQDKDTTNILLEMFELKLEDNNFSPPDFIPTDELGDSTYDGSRSYFEVENDYASVRIN